MLGGSLAASRASIQQESTRRPSTSKTRNACSPVLLPPLKTRSGASQEKGRSSAGAWRGPGSTRSQRWRSPGGGGGGAGRPRRAGGAPARGRPPPGGRPGRVGHPKRGAGRPEEVLLRQGKGVGVGRQDARRAGGGGVSASITAWRSARVK